MNFDIDDDQIHLQKKIIDFAKKELNEKIIEDDTNAKFPQAKWGKCSRMGLIGLCVPEEYGGQGLNLLTAITILESLAYGCRDNGLVHSLITDNLCAMQIARFGTEDQKAQYLPPICQGVTICAQAITEPDAGSDIGAIRTTAEKKNNCFVINGTKMFISNGPIADLILLFAVTDSAKKNFGRISCFLVKAENSGVNCCNPLDKMGLRTLQNGEIVFSDCYVGLEGLLGKVGQGLILFNEAMQWEKIMLFASHLGTLKRVMETTVKYAKARYQSNQPIGKYQMVSEKIAGMRVSYELGRLILHKAAWLVSQGRTAMLEASIAKLVISESLQRVCLDAVQIHGAYGYMKEFEIERDLRDSIASTIYSGTSEIQKIIIAALSGL
jgi:alkylation response protein AidB-like acyl-CoA dehydrogenase